MIPVPRLKDLFQPWVVREAPPWVARIPPTSGFYVMGATPPPVLVSSHPPPVLLAASGWQLTCEPLLPLMPVRFKQEPAVHQVRDGSADVSETCMRECCNAAGPVEYFTTFSLEQPGFFRKIAFC